MTDKKLLLHTCCGPCATASVERLLDEGWAVDLFYSNSNILSYDEYQRRLEGVLKIAGYFKVGLVEDEYDHDAWLCEIKGLEAEPEKGSRCGVCFEYSLGRTAAVSGGYSGWATTLTISPHKNSKLIFEIGKKAGGFIEYDFKKKNGFARSIELSKKLDLYRQQYCGCEFSMNRE
ncbi:MAG: epoxyqueuosine reductase QueH [Spirochaetales bacterium]|nr:epoxyqueuosine reductase QueH [Spirochaetales bacterium]